MPATSPSILELTPANPGPHFPLMIWLSTFTEQILDSGLLLPPVSVSPLVSPNPPPTSARPPTSPNPHIHDPTPTKPPSRTVASFAGRADSPPRQQIHQGGGEVPRGAHL